MNSRRSLSREGSASSEFVAKKRFRPFICLLRQRGHPRAAAAAREGVIGVVLVDRDQRHNIINGPSGPMKLYTLYSPPNHRDGVVHATKADAESDKEHFDGKTTE